uniref:Serine peptidase inhibitor, Kunitz type, 2 n=1 Tax=Seriola lalandi dorsalis TaxID=1841481 RepID=A0A3B4WW61_SERLL
MDKYRFRLSVLALYFLVWSGVALDCDWDQSIDPNQGLDLASLGVKVLQLGRLAEVKDPESCRAACCNEPNCDLALVGYPQDGGPQCLLVSCESQGRDVCVLQPSSQFKVYRRTVKREARGEKPHIVPLHGSWEPRTNETNNSSVLPDDSTPAPQMALSFDTNKSEDAEGPVESEPAATESVPPQETGMSAGEYDEHCKVEPQAGPCRAAFQHWYYNSRTGNCEPFIYGGCRGNKNNYISKENCVATCTVSVLPSSKKSSADDDEYKDKCMATPDPGPCRAAFPKFYYDHNTGTCQSFMYGGCRGNQNSYGTVEECMSRCSRDGSLDSRGKTRNSAPALFLLITLAAISVLLLVTLVFISLRRHRLSRRPSSVSDKEELLPDPDEQSSVESLTVPESPRPDKA